MANNKNYRDTHSTLLKNKIDELSLKVREYNQSGSSLTKDELMRQTNDFLTKFFEDLSGCIFDPYQIVAGATPDLEEYNKNLEDILSDLTVLFKELENIESISLSNFNFMVTNLNRLRSRVKSSYNKLSDYILFSNSPSKDKYFYSDSFSNLERVDFASGQLTLTQAEVDQIQGVVTLPIDTVREKAIQITEEPVINSLSNGTSGNSLEPQRGFNGDINVILDGNPDTWFEYERVTTDTENEQSLILDLSLILTEPTFVNYIRINPNNFGTKTPIKIEKIETSVDGKNFVSIKDDIPIAGFSTEDEENVFILSPSTSKYAGQGVYTFTPRLIKFVHISFSQNTPYTIRDNAGVLYYRYAIGLRDIEVAGKPYLDKGEVISQSFEFPEAIQKISIETHQNPAEVSELAEIRHSISPDDGSTWYDIDPINFTVSDKNIINFNNGELNSISTEKPVTALKYRATLIRNSDAFSSPNSSLHKSTERVTELHTVSDSSPFELELNSIPIKDSILVMRPMMGSRGLINTNYIVGHGTNSALQIEIPFKNLQKDITKVYQSGEWKTVETDPEVVSINGEIWTRGVLSSAGEEDKIYELDYKNGILKFGNNLNGKAVPGEASVNFRLKSERLFVGHEAENHNASLDYVSNAEQKHMNIERRGLATLDTDILKPGNKVHQLENKNLTGYYLFSDLTVFAAEQSFVNGTAELTAPGHYSVDQENGIVYSYSQTSTTASNNTVVTYEYTPTFELETNEWEFVDDSLPFDGIKIYDNSFVSNSINNIELSSGRRYFSLEHMSILPKSLRFSGTGSSFFEKEVPFINGVEEFSTAVKVTDKLPSVTQLLNGVYQYDFRLKPLSGYNIDFTNSEVFVQQVGSVGLVNSPGKYFIDLVSNPNAIHVWLDAGEYTLGQVTYSCINPSKSSKGLFSVNYKTGEIYTSEITVGSVEIDYSYTDYVAKYHIAEVVDLWTLDTGSNTITIDETEVIDRTNLEGPIDASYYQIAFKRVVENRENVADIEPYFTPVLRDYTISALPENII